MAKAAKGSQMVWHGSSIVFSLIVTLSLVLTSCTLGSSTPMTQTVIEVTSTPASTPTTKPFEETSLPILEIDALMNELVNQAPLAGIALGI